MSQSQSSTTSLQYTFTPIGGNGDIERNTQSTKLDKAVSSVSNLQDNASKLKACTKVVDEILASLDRFKGIPKDIAKLKHLRETLVTVADAIKVDALILAPLPGKLDLGHLYVVRFVHTHMEGTRLKLIAGMSLLVLHMFTS